MQELEGKKSNDPFMLKPVEVGLGEPSEGP